MFPGGFGRPPPRNDDIDDEEDDDEVDEEAAAAMLAAAGGGQQVGMQELLAMLGGGGGGGAGGVSRGGGAHGAPQDEEEDVEDEDVDETLGERLLGLTEMFPDRVRNFLVSAIKGTVSTAVWTWTNGQALAWAVTATSMVAIMPVVIERERHQFQQEQLAQQRQILLGPGAAPGQAAGSMYSGLVPPGLK